MKRKITSLLLALSLCLGLAVPAALAAGDFQTTNDVLTKYTGPGGDVVIPSGILAIRDGVFKGREDLTSVTIPEGVTSIGESAFYGCSSLTSVAIPDSVTSIGKYAFYGCSSLTDLTIPEGVTKIGTGAFRNCSSLTGVTIPNGIPSIGGNVFEGCSSLTGVTIPAGVTSIGEDAFRGCSSLTSVTIPEGVISIGYCVFEDCTSLTSVTIPDSVTSIGGNAFENCYSLTDLTLPKGVIIGGEAFKGCNSLTSVTIPEGVTLGEWAFSNRSLTSVTLLGNATRVEDRAFFLYEDKKLTSLTIYPEVDNIDRYGFKVDSETTVYGAESSYAQLWAMENGCAFEATLPPSTTPSRTAYSSTQTVLVDGAPVEFQAYALKDKNGNPTNYVKLRDVASVLSGTSAQFNVGWDGKVSVTTGTPYTPNGSEMTTPYSGDRTYSSIGTDIVRLDGKDKSMLSLLLKDTDGNGYTYFKLRDLGAALGFKVDWTAEKGIFIETK